MSKQINRKITVSLTSKSKTLPKTRPSVFERLGTKATTLHAKEFCHHWAQNGTCPYGKGCKYSSTHTLVSPSKQRAAKSQIDVKHRHSKEAHKRIAGGELEAEYGQTWDPEELEDADPDDLEKRRQELQRELEIQMKMEITHKKTKKLKKESSPSSDSSSSSSESSSTTEESSSSSTSSGEIRKKKLKKTKKRDSSSSSEDRSRKHKMKLKRNSSKSSHDKNKKVEARPVKLKSVSPPRRKQSQTPPPKSKTFVPSKATPAENKSPRPSSRSSAKEKKRTPSPKLRDKEKEKEHEREKEKIKEKEKEKEKEREKERDRVKERERMKDKDRPYKKKEPSPKRDFKGESRSLVGKDKKRDTPDSSHSRDRKSSPGRSRSGNTPGGSKRDQRSPIKDDRITKKDERDRSRQKDKNESQNRKDCKSSRERECDRERDRERERRIEREKREAAREKERAEALARCQERQRERERLKELQKKEEDRNRSRGKNRRDDRTGDKPANERIERPMHSKERVSSSRKGHSIDRDRGERRDRECRDRSASGNRSTSRKSLERHDCDIEESRNFDRIYDQRTTERSYDRDRDLEHERDYPVGGRVRETETRRLDDKEFTSPYDRSRIEARRYMEMDEHYDNSREAHLALDRGVVDAREYPDDRRPHRELWDIHDERNLDHRERDIDPRRYDETRLSPSIKPREWDHPDYALPDTEWGRRRDWDMQTWDAATEEEWRLYNANRPVEGWQGEDRRNWAANWRDNSRPRSVASHRDDQFDNRRRNDYHHRGNRNDRGGRNEHGRKEFRNDHNRGQDHTRVEHHNPRGSDFSNRHEISKTDQEPAKTETFDSFKHEEQTIEEAKNKEEISQVKENVEKLDKPEPLLTSEVPAEKLIDNNLPSDTEEKNNTSLKRPAEPVEEGVPEPKKSCIEPVLEDDLSEISDDADEILNRDEEPLEKQIEEPVHTLDYNETTKESSVFANKVKSPNRSPSNRLTKEESLDDENMDLDFEEISEDELEEESKVKGIGDALGVDWASLVAESRPLTKPISSAKKLWDGNNVLVNLGISLVYAGEEMAKEIMEKYKKSNLNIEVKSEPSDIPNIKKEEESDLSCGETEAGELNVHPVAGMQVAVRAQESVRKNLFTSAGPYRRALSARRDLKIRRHLCNLPLNDSYIGAQKRHDPELYKQALALYLKCKC